MSASSLSKQSMRPTKRDSLVRMLVEVVMILMYTPMVVLEHTFVVRSLPLSNPLRENLVDPDLSHHSQLILDCTAAQQQ
jgi:hypothetical protein